MTAPAKETPMTRLKHPARAALTLAFSLAVAPLAGAQDARPSPERPAAPTARADKGADGRAALIKAYQKEYAILASEEKELGGRLKALSTELDEKTAALEEDIAALDAEAARLQEALAVRREEARAAEALNARTDDGQQALDGILTQAALTLEEAGIKAPAASSEPDRPAAIEARFKTAIALLEELGSIRKQPGAFFSKDGRQVQGEIIRIGQIAAFGVGGQDSGILVPAGRGHLKLWRPDPAASLLAEGRAPAALPLFLYESADKGIEERREKTAVELVEAGGVIAYAIVALGGFALLLLIVRSLILLLASARADRSLEAAAPLIEQGRLDAALSAVDAQRGAPARLLAACIPFAGLPAERLENVVSEKVLAQSARVERFRSAITVCAAVAPLLGLLGTVTGMITTFEVITVNGAGDPKLLSGGISEALITTQLGLMVAIPALLWGNLLSGWSEKITGQVETAALRFLSLGAGRAS